MESRPSSTKEPEPNRPALRVLVVEDQAATAAVLAAWLRLHGYQVQVAPDALAAFQAAHRDPPDVVLLDIGLPILDGYHLARRWREQGSAKRPLLVAVTGLGEEEDRRRSEQAGIDLHLVKPVDPAVLHQVLTRFQTLI
jgi:CheY-like chemotaxis protein